MNIERILFFIFKYNILIIELLFAVSLLGVLLLAFRFFTSKEEAGDGISPDWNRLEDNIKKILENATGSSAKLGGAVSGAPIQIPEGMEDGAFIQELQTQLERAQIQLMQKDEELKKLNSIAGAAEGSPENLAPNQANPVGTADVGVYEDKIKDLESRLNEYSIIEDDIADLSFYKEETVRLQSEVDKLTAELTALKEAEAAAPKTVMSPPALAVVPSPPSPPVEVSVDVAVVVPRPEPDPIDSVYVPPPEKSAAPPETSFVDNDIMAEFEQAVVAQKVATAASKTAKAELKAEQLAEKKSQTDNEESSEDAQEGEINMDKMLNEVQDLTVSEEAEDVPNSIDATLDTDRLLREATGMGNIDSEALTEFNDFVKKEGA